MAVGTIPGGQQRPPHDPAFSTRAHRRQHSLYIANTIWRSGVGVAYRLREFCKSVAGSCGGEKAGNSDTLCAWREPGATGCPDADRKHFVVVGWRSRGTLTCKVGSRFVARAQTGALTKAVVNRYRRLGNCFCEW